MRGKIIVVISAAAGTILSARAGSEAFMGGGTVFMYFTIQSNIALALICAIGAVLLLRPGDRLPGGWWFIVKFVGTVSITLTGMDFFITGRYYAYKKRMLKAGRLN